MWPRGHIKLKSCVHSEKVILFVCYPQAHKKVGKDVKEKSLSSCQTQSAAFVIFSKGSVIQKAVTTRGREDGSAGNNSYSTSMRT